MLARAADLSQFLGLRKEMDREGGTVTAVVDRVDELPARWALMVGDALNNARAALDYAAGHLVSRGRIPNPRFPNKVQFTIEEAGRNEFDSQAGTQLPGVLRDHLAAVRRVQPYHENSSAADHPLAVLRRLNNKDKHQRLHLTAMYSYADFDARIEEAHDFALESTLPGPDLYQCLAGGFFVGARLIVVSGVTTGDNANVVFALKGQCCAIVKDGPKVIPLPSLVDGINDTVADVLGRLEPLL
jgi:hypothetical protein